MVKLFGGRVASALVAVSMFGVSSSANAEATNVAPVSFDLKAVAKAASTIANPVVAATNAASSIEKPVAVAVDAAATLTKPVAAAADVAATLAKPVVAATTAVANAAGNVLQAQPARSVTLSLDSSVAAQAAWLYKGGWPLYALVDKFATNKPLDEQMNCLATAVYFEARGETVEGQLAVAKVVMNRAASGKYPTDWCSVVKQPYQFSFVRRGEFPAANRDCMAWKRAEAIAELAVAGVVPTLSDDVLWYHADYVAPTWRNNLQEVQKIGAHIFYRA